MKKKELYAHVLTYLQSVSPPTDTELNYNTTFQLLVAVVLSAQCTDKRINEVTPALFSDYPDAETMSLASPDVIFEYIRSVSYPNNKSKHLVGLAKMIMTEFGGKVPEDFEVLVRLPGVGRKTANVVSALAFGKAALAVDTHVYRVSRRIGLVPQTANTPLKVEMCLRKYIKEEHMADAHFWLLYHGRYTCMARKPLCSRCELTPFCTHYKRNNPLGF